VAESRADILVSGMLVLELKSVDRLVDVHRMQLLAYLRIHRISLGLLINFNVPVLYQGIRRVIASR
jgi:GxxExxY protein